MRRREFITLLGGAAAASPLAARAQPRERLPRIGYLSLTSAAQHAYGGSDAFLAGLSDLGYIEGRNIRVEFRFAEGDEDRLPGLATELVGLNVDVIVTYATGVFAARAPLRQFQSSSRRRPMSSRLASFRASRIRTATSPD